MATEKRLIIPDELIAEIEILYQKHYVHSYDKTVHDIFNAIRRRIRKCSTVDAVEVVHGVWENVKETEVYSPDHRCTFTHTAQTCSVCNVRIGFIGAKFYLYDGYCPNCDAKMDGDGNE